MQLKVLAAGVLAAAIAAPVCASAAQVIVPTVTLPGPGQSTEASWTYQFTVPTFNTSLGTLTSVDFLLSDTTSVAIQVTNNNATDVAFTNATASIPLTITGPGSLNLTDTITSTMTGGVAAPGVNNYLPTSSTQSANTSLTTGLSAYESGTPALVSILADAGVGLYGGAGGANTDFGGTANVSGAFQVIYNYTSAVPEPATWAMLLLGVAGLGLALRARRKDDLALTAA